MQTIAYFVHSFASVKRNNETLWNLLCQIITQMQAIDGCLDPQHEIKILRALHGVDPTHFKAVFQPFKQKYLEAKDLGGLELADTVELLHLLKELNFVLKKVENDVHFQRVSTNKNFIKVFAVYQAYFESLSDPALDPQLFSILKSLPDGYLKHDK